MQRWLPENRWLHAGDEGYFPPRAPEDRWQEYLDAKESDPNAKPPVGYDEKGDRLPYANYRPPIDDATVRKVWWAAVEKWVIGARAGEVRVKDINDVEVDVMWENNTAYRSLLDDLKTELDAAGDNPAQVAQITEKFKNRFLSDTTPLPSRNKIWDMGHFPEAMYADLQAQYLRHDIDLDKFKARVNDETTYRVEDWLRNRSHRDEAQPESN